MNIIKTASEIIAKLLNAKGQNSTAKWQSVVKTSASFKHLNITKITSAVVRSGIDFQNLKSTKDAIENGTKEANGELPWGKWLSFPHIIGHNNKEYVRLYPSSDINHIPKVSYFVDGISTPKAEILQYLTASTAKKMLEAKTPECFTLTSTNVLDIVELAD